MISQVPCGTYSHQSMVANVKVEKKVYKKLIDSNSGLGGIFGNQFGSHEQKMDANLKKPNYVPSPEFIKAYVRCQVDPNFIHLACLKRCIKMFNKTMKQESFFNRTAIGFNRKILVNSTVGKADCLFREKFVLLNEAEKNYIHDIVHINSPILKIKELKLPNGEGTYSGYILNGIPHGDGKLVFKDFSFYEGEFNEGKMTGTGTRYYHATKNLPSYTEKGFFIDGVWQGKILRNPLYDDDSIELSGEKGIKNDLKAITNKKEVVEQVANLILKNGNYTGLVCDINGLRVPHGKGKLITLNNEKLKGIFANGELLTGVKVLRKNGSEVWMATVNTESNALNKGAFYKPGRFTPLLNGEGVIRFKDGSRAKGNFLEGKLHGYGEKIRMHNKTEILQKGIFKKGMFTQEARILNNEIYYSSQEGTFDQNDRLNGTGRLQRLDGSKIKGFFVKGQLQEVQGDS